MTDELDEGLNNTHEKEYKDMKGLQDKSELHNELAKTRGREEKHMLRIA